MDLALELAELGRIPRPLVRAGIRRLLRARLHGLDPTAGRQEVVARMRSSPLAVATGEANRQHYELPSAFFERVLGRRLKYSSGYWPEDTTSLDDAEEAALALTCTRAGIEDGMEVLDLGCGWGSLSLWIAERYPGCRVTAVSNSSSQGAFIRRRAGEFDLRNLDVLRSDMARIELDRRWDRIVSVEMFEHMRNWELLMGRVACWLAPAGKLFVHHFCHRSAPYFFEDQGSGDWMARHFFTGGLMPSHDLLDAFAGALEREDRWRLDGTHYEKTALAWLGNLDRRAGEVREILRPVYGVETERWLGRWRLFFLACAELFGFDHGREWFVSHSLWTPRSTRR